MHELDERAVPCPRRFEIANPPQWMWHSETILFFSPCPQNDVGLNFKFVKFFPLVMFIAFVLHVEYRRSEHPECFFLSRLRVRDREPVPTSFEMGRHRQVFALSHAGS